ncbi:ClbS/DfsB family four-helix bundle protein [Pelagibius sp.]|uniref:ClbS/DfsB family four-helix bundle protein n=1 Tax=Pelagibius sp. TaxID=1931238 RepID=UPI003BAFF071
MAAQNKDELLAVSKKEFGKLEKLTSQVDPPSALIKDDEDTSVKDIIAHRAHWIDLFLGWYRDGLAGKPVHFPAEGYKWNELKRYNADLRAQQADIDWDEALAMLRKNHGRLLRLLQRCSNEELYGGPMKGANNNWTPGRWAEAAGPSHFRSAAKYIRSRLKVMT